jgi:hypothetical protein
MVERKSMNSRTKGKVGEREAAELLREHGFNARRGQQFSGSPDSPDIVVDIPIHFEVKRVENLNIGRAMEQSIRDAAPHKTPVVLHRRNGQNWLITMRATQFLEKYAVIHKPNPMYVRPEEILKPSGEAEKPLAAVNGDVCGDTTQSTNR